MAFNFPVLQHYADILRCYVDLNLIANSNIHEKRQVVPVNQDANNGTIFN